MNLIATLCYGKPKQRKMKTKNNNTGRRPANTVEEVISRLRRESGKEGGSIFLADLCAEVPHIPKAEVIKTLRNSNAGAFVVGRRGAASRWVYGEMAKNLPQAQPSYTSPNQGGRKRIAGGRGVSSINVRVSMGNNILFNEDVPLSIALQPV